MSLSTTQARYQYTGNGVATVFSFPEQFHNSSDLVVRTTVSGADSLRVLNTDYTVNGANDPAGGAVVFLIAPANGIVVTITREPSPTQTVDYVPQDDFPAETHEKSLDKLTMLVQSILVQLNRALRLPVTGASVAVPDAVTRAGKAWAFDSSGNIILVGRNELAEQVTQTAIDSASAASLSAASALESKVAAGSFAAQAENAADRAETDEKRTPLYRSAWTGNTLPSELTVTGTWSASGGVLTCSGSPSLFGDQKVVVQRTCNIDQRVTRFRVRTPASSITGAKCGLGIIPFEAAFHGTALRIDWQAQTLEIFETWGGSTTAPAVRKSISIAPWAGGAFPVNREFIVDLVRDRRVNRVMMRDVVTGQRWQMETAPTAFLLSGGNDNAVYGGGLQYDRPFFAHLAGASSQLVAIDIFANVKRPLAGFYGDSIVDGYGNLDDDCFARLCIKSIQANGQDAYLSGRPSGNIQGILDRITVELPALLPKYMFMTIGTNETGYDATWKAKYIQAIEYAQGLGIIVILGAIYPKAAAGAVTSVNAWIRTTATTYGCKVISFDAALATGNDPTAGLQSYFFSDGIHPNSLGNQRAFAQIIMDAPELVSRNTAKPLIRVDLTYKSLVAGRTFVAEGASRTVFTLPRVVEEGDTFAVINAGAGGFRIGSDTSDTGGARVVTIQGGGKTSTATGYIDSTGADDMVVLQCVASASNGLDLTANPPVTMKVIGVRGSPTIVDSTLGVVAIDATVGATARQEPNGLSFDNTNNCRAVATMGSETIGTSPWSARMRFVVPDTAGSFHGQFLMGPNTTFSGGDANSFVCYIDSSGRLAFQIAVDGSNYQQWSISNFRPKYSGQMVEVVLKHGGAGDTAAPRAYVNGVAETVTFVLGAGTAPWGTSINSVYATIGGTGNSNNHRGTHYGVQLFNLELSEAQIAALASSGLTSLPQYRRGSQVTQNSGTLLPRQTYQIVNYVAGDSFTNIGAGSNATGVIFVATGTTPTTWTNGSTIKPLGCMANWDFTQANQRGATCTEPVNGLHLSLSSGCEWMNPQNGPLQDFGSAAPTTGTWPRGFIRWNTAPSASGFIGWSCVTAGTPGTWKTFGAISA